MAGKPLAKGSYKWLTALEWAGWEGEQGGSGGVGAEQTLCKILRSGLGHGQPLHKKNIFY